METKILVVEDEQRARELICYYLRMYRAARIVGVAKNCAQAIALIDKLKPDIVMMDIELPDGSGLDVIARFKPNTFKTIIVSGHDDYAIKALRLATVDYILKPPSKDAMFRAIERASQLIHEGQAGYEALRQYLSKSPDMDRLLIPSDSSKHSILFSDIVYVRSDGGYSIFYTTDNRHIITSRAISYFEKILPANFFFRTHKSFIVNFVHITTVPAGRSGVIELGGLRAQLSVRKAASFRRWYRDRTL